MTCGAQSWSTTSFSMGNLEFRSVSLQLRHYPCITITVSLSLSLHHYHCIAITASLSLHCYHCFTITVSLSLHHYPCVIIPASLSLYHYQPVIYPLQQAAVQGVWNSVCITVTASLSVCHPPWQAAVWGVWYSGLHHSHCITITNSLSPPHHNRLYSMGSLVFRCVASLSLYHYQSVTYPPQQAAVWGVWYSGLYHYHCITITVSLSLTHHNRLHHSNDCVWFQLQPLCHKLLAEAVHTGVMWQRSWAVGRAQR